MTALDTGAAGAGGPGAAGAGNPGADPRVADVRARLHAAYLASIPASMRTWRVSTRSCVHSASSRSPKVSSPTALI